MSEVAARLRERAATMREPAPECDDVDELYVDLTVERQAEARLLDLLADCYEQLAWQIAPETRALLARIEELAT